MTEYLGKLNKKKTIMLMHGDKFSIIPNDNTYKFKKCF